jgi:uncharacterized protein YcfJ
MSKLLNRSVLCLAAISLVTVVPAAIPTSASAYTRYICKYEQKRREHNGAVVGAITGALIGSQVSKNERGLGALAGGAAGAAIGSKMGHDSGKKACLATAAYRTRVVYSKDSRGRSVKTVYRYVYR